MIKYKPLMNKTSETTDKKHGVTVTLPVLLVIIIVGLAVSVFVFWLSAGKPTPNVNLAGTTYTYPEHDIYKMITTLVYSNAEIEYEVIPDEKQEKIIEYKGVGDKVSYKACLHQRTYKTMNMLDGLYDSLLGGDK